jgi:hypothetical protein
MATKAFTALLCSLAIVGQMRAQEVTVARETKPSVPEPATSASGLTGSESESATPKKAPNRKKKSTETLPTVEQMRTAGVLAAERLKNQGRVEKAKASPTPKPEVAREQPVPGESLRNEKPVEQSSVRHESKSGAKKLEALGPIGPIRPTIMESGRQETDTSHSAKGEKGESRTREDHVPQSTNSS